MPYKLGAHARYRSGGDTLNLTFVNIGKAGVVLQVLDLLDNESPSEYYAAGVHRRLYGSFQGNASGDYHLEVYDPNGFLRAFRGNL